MTNPNPNLLYMLTPREVDVLASTARGLTNTETAAALAVHPQTVKNHLTNIRRKLKVKTTIAAFAAVGWTVVDPGVPPERRSAVPRRADDRRGTP